MVLMALLAISPAGASDQNSTKPAPTPPAAAKPASAPLAKLWHSEATQHDFRVDATDDLFRADWVNIPPVAAKQGAHIHTECRKAGNKWVGTSSISMLFGVPGAPAGKDTKLCSLKVRFEVESIAPDKITGHSESLHAFDVNACRVQETKWAAFTWVPRK
jgi:hypothetical protein